MGRERFLNDLRACALQESVATRRRPVSLLRHDLPLAPFCFNAGLLLSPAAMPAPGCNYPWDSEADRLAPGEAPVCNQDQLAASTGIAAQRATLHSQECHSGPKVTRHQRRGCCFERIEAAVAQQLEYVRLQRKARASLCPHEPGSKSNRTSNPADHQISCCRRWTETAWQHNEIHVTWRLSDVIGVYYVRPTDEPHARTMLAAIAAAKRPAGFEQTSLIAADQERVDIVHICGDQVPGRIIRATPTKRQAIRGTTSRCKGEKSCVLTRLLATGLRTGTGGLGTTLNRTANVG